MQRWSNSNVLFIRATFLPTNFISFWSKICYNFALATENWKWKFCQDSKCLRFRGISPSTLSYQYNCHSRTPRVYSCTPNIFLSRAMTETGIKTWFLRAHHCIPTEREVALDEQLSWLRVWDISPYPVPPFRSFKHREIGCISFLSLTPSHSFLVIMLFPSVAFHHLSVCPLVFGVKSCSHAVCANMTDGMFRGLVLQK